MRHGAKITVRLKDYFRQEQQKLQGYSFKDKVKYILDYYWLWILGVFVAVLFLGNLLWHGLMTPKENEFYIMYANTRENVGNHSPLWEDFARYADYDLNEKNMEFNANCYFDPSSSGGAVNSYYQSFVTFIDTGTLDAVTMEMEDLIAVGRGGRLLDLESDRCVSLMEKYKDRLVYTVPYDESYGKDKIPVGIDISDSILMTEYHLYPETCVLGIGAHTQHIDAVEMFLEYILEG